MLLQETLIEILNHMKDLHLKIDAITTILNDKRSHKRKTTTNVTPLNLKAIKHRITTAVTDYWRVQSLPISKVSLNRSFMRKCIPFGGLQYILLELVKENHLYEFQNLTGSSAYIMPKSAWDKMNVSLRETLLEIGLTGKQLEILQKTKTNYIESKQRVSERLSDFDEAKMLENFKSVIEPEPEPEPKPLTIKASSDANYENEEWD